MKRAIVAVLLLLAVAFIFVEARPSRQFFNCLRNCGKNNSKMKCLSQCKKSTVEAARQGSMAMDEHLSDEDMLNVLSEFLWDDNEDGGDDDDTNNTPPANPIDQKLIWENYRNELFKFLKRGGDVSGMQLLRTPITADWDVDQENLFALSNRISAWGVEYNPREGLSVPQQYGLFLNSIDIDTNSANSGSNPEVENAQIAYDNAVARLANIRASCRALYDRYPGTKPTYEEFESMRCLSVGNALADVQIKEFELEFAKRRSAGPHADLAEARAKFTADDGSFAWSESFMSTLSRFKKRISDGMSDSFSISVTKSSRSNTAQREWSELDTMSDFITIEEDAEEEEGEEEKKPKKKGGKKRSRTSTKFEFTTSADDFKMEIKAPGYTNIQVAPGEWFSHSVLSNYKNGPFTGKVNFFGEEGTFNQMTKSLYVLYKPSVSLYVEQQDAVTLHSLATEKTIKLGPFTADTVRVSETPVSSRGSRDIYKVDFIVSTEEPIVVAIDNHLF